MIKDYAEIEELSAALLNTLIEKVAVGESKEVDGERIQEVKIYYKFIGNISWEGHILSVKRGIPVCAAEYVLLILSKKFYEISYGVETRFLVMKQR
ncbi:MAG: DUF4368 domain-containing protein [Eubacterium sp.]|nr:DUF4368 domain-containing protein [Eubacterium sp.]